MAKYLRYRGEFLSLSGVTWRVELLQESEYPFNIGELEFDVDQPLTIDWSGKSKEDVLCGAVATLKIISPGDRTYEDLYSVDVCRVRMDVYRNNSLYWSGCLDTEFYEEPYHLGSGYTVSLTFSDFGVLDRVKYNRTGLVSLQEIVSYAVTSADLNVVSVVDRYISTSLSEGGSSLHLRDLKVRSDNFYDEDGEASTLSDVLKGIFQPLGIRLIQRHGSIYAYDLNGLYTKASTSPIVWDGDSQDMSVDRVYNNARITWSPYAQSGNQSPENCWSEDIKTPVTSTALNLIDGMSTDTATYFSFHYSTTLDDWIDATDCGFTLWTATQGEHSTILDPRAKYFKIVPQYDGTESEGVALFWRSAVGYRSAGTSVYQNKSFGIDDLGSGYFATIGSPAFKSSEVWIPPVNNPEELLIRVKLDLLLDVRFNPFESATKLMSSVDQKENYDLMEEYGNLVYVPIKIKFQPDNSDEVYVWDNSAVVSAETPVRTLVDTLGEWTTNASSKGFFAYYDPSDRDTSCGVLGWQSNRPAINSHTEALVTVLANAEEGQCIPYPTEGGGRLWVEVLNTGWRIMNGGDSINQGVNGGTKTLFDKLTWALVKLPVIEIINNQQFGIGISTDDVEYQAELLDSAKESIEIDTICGTAEEGVSTARGAYFDAITNRQVTCFSRAGRTTQVEDLLIGTLYSQYAHRHTRLSGEAVMPSEPIATYTEANQDGKLFMIIEESQDIRLDCSNLTIVELRPDEYTRDNE